MKMNYRQKQALQTVIDYLYDDEEENYSELKDEGIDVRKHIFISIKELVEYLNYDEKTDLIKKFVKS